MKKSEVKKIVKRRIHNLLELARKNPENATKYVQIAWKLKISNKIKLNKNTKLQFCKKCHTVWIPGKTVKVRIINGFVTYICNCGYMRKVKKVEGKKIHK